MDNKFLQLIHRFLKAGTEMDGVVHPTHKGVPQGGVLSPLLSNAVLNKFDWFMHSKGKHDQAMKRAHDLRQSNIRCIRYADDWCVFITRASKRIAQALREEIATFLSRECGLQLSTEKTRITHVQEGFDFLGFRIERSMGKRGRFVPKIKVTTKAVAQARVRLDQAMRYRPHQESVACRIQRASAVIRGWSNYYCIAHNFSGYAGKLDHYAFWSAVKAVSRKLDISAAKVLSKYYRKSTIWVDPTCRLIKFSDTKMKLDYHKPTPYEPGKAVYEDDHELEASFQYLEGHRQGQADLKWHILKRDQYQCRRCHRTVTAKTSQLDHIQPVRSFARFEQANSPENLQTLCHACHCAKSRSEKA